jgi:hypothetical protein
MLAPASFKLLLDLLRLQLPRCAELVAESLSFGLKEPRYGSGLIFGLRHS